MYNNIQHSYNRTYPIVNLMELLTCQLKLKLTITSVNNPHKTILEWSQFQMLKWSKTDSCAFFSRHLKLFIYHRNMVQKDSFFLQISRDAFVLVRCCQPRYHDSLSGWSVHQVHQVKFTLYQYTLHYCKKADPKLLL